MPLDSQQHAKWFESPATTSARPIGSGEFPQTMVELIAHARSHLSSKKFNIPQIFQAIKWKIEEAAIKLAPETSLVALNQALNQICGEPTEDYVVDTGGKISSNWPKIRQRLWLKMHQDGYFKYWPLVKSVTDEPPAPSELIPTLLSTAAEVLLYLKLFESTLPQKEKQVKDWLHSDSSNFQQKTLELIDRLLLSKQVDLLPIALANTAKEDFCALLYNSKILLTIFKENPPLIERLRELRSDKQLHADFLYLIGNVEFSFFEEIIESTIFAIFTRDHRQYPEYVGEFDDTALHRAAFCDKEEIVILLLKMKADPVHKKPAGNTPIDRTLKESIRKIISDYAAMLGKEAKRIDSSFNFPPIKIKEINQFTSFPPAHPSLPVKPKKPIDPKIPVLFKALESDDWSTLGNFLPNTKINRAIMGELMTSAKKYKAESCHAVLIGYCEDNPDIRPPNPSSPSTSSSSSSSSSLSLTSTQETPPSRTLVTEGDGNCFFHALFGDFHDRPDDLKGMTRKLYDEKHQNHRQLLAEHVSELANPKHFLTAAESVKNFLDIERTAVPASRLLNAKYPLLFALYSQKRQDPIITPAHLQEYHTLIHDHQLKEPNKKLIGQLNAIYTGITTILADSLAPKNKKNLLQLKAFAKERSIKQKDAWNLLKSAIQANAELSILLTNMSHLYRKESGVHYGKFEEQYNHMCNRHKEEFIAALEKEKLIELYNDYTEKSSENNLNLIGSAHIEEYAQILGEDGRFLSMEEVELVAVCFNFTINLHVKNLETEDFQLINTLNPGCSAKYEICHDSRLHFERMAGSARAVEVTTQIPEKKTEAATKPDIKQASLETSLGPTLFHELRNGQRRKRLAGSMESSAMELPVEETPASMPSSPPSGHTSN